MDPEKAEIMDPEKGTASGEGPGEGSPPAYQDYQSTTAAPAYTDEPPPSYENAVLGKIMDIKTNSADNKELAKNLFVYICCGTVSAIIIIVLCLAIPIAHITVGALYIEDCPKERMIPIYLIVSGVFTLLKGLIGICENVHKRKSNSSDEDYQRPKAFACLDGPIGCFLFAWFIAGNVWIFRTKNHYQSEDPSLPEFCNETLYLYAFWTQVAAYIAIGVGLLLCCCITCVACCVGASKAKK